MEDYDSDLKITKLIRVIPNSKHFWFHKFQHFYAPLAYTTYSLFWVFIKDFVIYPPGYGKTVIPWFVRYLRDQGYEPIGLGAGIDRMKDYQNQVKYITGPKSDTPVSPDFEVRLVDTRDGDGPSGTKVRQALKDDDRAVFNSLMPAELHKYYEEMKKYIDK